MKPPLSFSLQNSSTPQLRLLARQLLLPRPLPTDIQVVTSAFVPSKPTGAVVTAGSTASNGASQIGANVGSNNAIRRNLFTVDDHVFWTVGHHQLEIGAWLQRLQSNGNLAQNQYGQASFASLQTFLAGKIKTFTVVPTPT